MGTTRVMTKPFKKEIGSISLPLTSLMMPRVLSMLVAPPEATGARTSILAKRGARKIVRISLRMLAVKAMAPSVS